MVVALFAPPLEVQLEAEAWIRWVTPFYALVNYYCKGGHHHKMGAGNWDHHPGNRRFITNFKIKDVKEVMMAGVWWFSCRLSKIGSYKAANIKEV